MDKSPDAFRTISEVAGDLDLPQHVLRFWETRFVQIKPLKRGGGRRYYRPDDIDLLKGIRHLLYGEGYTIRGVQRILKEQGIRFVMDVWREGAPQPPPAAGAGRWDSELGFDRPGADPAADEWAEPAAPPPRPVMETWAEDDAGFEPVISAAEVSPGRDAHHGDDLTRFSAPIDDFEVSPEPSPSSEEHRQIPEALPRTPFTIGRATPLDPGFQARRDPSRPPLYEDGGEGGRLTGGIPVRAAGEPPRPLPADMMPVRPAGEATPRLRAERIAGFALHNSIGVAPLPTPVGPVTTMPVAESGVDPASVVARPSSVEPPPPAVELPPFTGAQARARISGQQRGIPDQEPHRGGLGHLFDRLRPAPAPAVAPDLAAPVHPAYAAVGDRGGERGRAQPSLSRDEIRRLQSTLFELLECKRILDQAR